MWTAKFTPRPLYLRGQSPRSPLDRRLSGPQSRSRRFEDRKFLTLQGLEFKQKYRGFLKIKCSIWRHHGSEYQDYTPLACDTTLCYIWSPKFRGTCCLHLQCKGVKMEAAGSSNTQVLIYHITQYNFPHNCNLQQNIYKLKLWVKRNYKKTNKFEISHRNNNQIIHSVTKRNSHT